MELGGEGGYGPPPEFEEDGKEPLIDLSLTNSSELWLIQLPSQESIVDIDGRELSLKLHLDGQLASIEGSSGKVYDLVSFSALESDATVFISSSTESKMVGKISRQVSLAHYPDPKELEKVNSVCKRQTSQSSAGISMTTSSRYFPMQSSKRHNSQSGQAVSTHSSRQKSSVSQVSEPSNTPKRRFVSESYLSRDQSSGRRTPEPSRSTGRGHSTGNSSMSSEHSRGEKSRKRFKHKE